MAVPLRQSPVHRLGTLLDEQVVGPTERPRAEEPTVRRHRRRMSRLDRRKIPQQRPQITRVTPPQNRHQRLAPPDQRPDRLLSHLLPPLTPMRRRTARSRRQRPVQQQHPLFGPRRQITARRPGHPQIRMQLPENVLQTPRQRTHLGRHSETQPDRHPRRRIRILAHNQDTNIIERLLKSPQNIRPRRQIRPARRNLRPEEITHRSNTLSRRTQSLRPARFNKFIQRSRRHSQSPYWHTPKPTQTEKPPHTHTAPGTTLPPHQGHRAGPADHAADHPEGGERVASNDQAAPPSSSQRRPQGRPLLGTLPSDRVGAPHRTERSPGGLAPALTGRRDADDRTPRIVTDIRT
jgi:hypothetical protein